MYGFFNPMIKADVKVGSYLTNAWLIFWYNYKYIQCINLTLLHVQKHIILCHESVQ